MLGGRAVSIGVVVAAIAISAVLSWHPFGAGSQGPAIHVDGRRLVVENQTRQPWHDVTVTVNAYYRGAAPTLEPGGRLEAPLDSLVSGLGYRFNTAREHVMRVEVRATNSRGKPVALDWDETSGKVVDESDKDHRP